MTKNLPTKKLTPQEQFEVNIREKLQKDIGKLIPDEVIQSMIEQTVKKMFHEKTSTRDRFGGVIEADRSWFEQELWDLVKPICALRIRAWLADNRNDVSGMIQTALTAGMPIMIGNLIADILSGAASNIEMDIIAKIQQRMQQQF